MTTTTALIRSTFEMPTMVVKGYLDDLSDDDLFVRPHPQSNHIAWQLGHLILGEVFHMNHVKPGSQPPLPEGFSDKHTKETASSDDRSQFLTKQEYLDLMAKHREATFKLLDSLTDEELAGPSPKEISYLGPTVASVFTGESIHWTMHAGQWAVIRRILGKPPLF